VKSPAETRRIEVSGTTVICGHDDAQWGTPTKGADFYDWRSQASIRGRRRGCRPWAAAQEHRSRFSLKVWTRPAV